MVREYSGLIGIGQRLFDAALIVGARYMVCVPYRGRWDNSDTLVTAVALVSYLVFAEVHGVYRSWRATPVREEVRTTLWSWALTSVPVLLWLFATKTSVEHSRLASVLWFASVVLALGVSRGLKSALLRSLREQGRNTRTAGIIGATPIAKRLIRELADRSHGIEVRGVYDARNDDRVTPYLAGGKLAGDINQAIADARAGKLDLIYLALPLRAEKRIAEAVEALADTTATVQMVTDFSAFDLLHARWASVGRLPAVALFDSPFSGNAAWIKRVEDIVLSALFLLLLAPVMLVIALLVKLTSRGPVFFAQTRYGLNGKPIRVLKFRSMTVQENGTKVTQATKGDARITKLGAFLRASSLDELPQFINVLRGEMSIVGPRPHAVAHNEEYRTLIHGYMLRHKVKPGITGWAQVNGFRGETDTLDKMKARVEYDLQYIENWDLRWDLEIIFRTAFKVIGDKNAY